MIVQEKKKAIIDWISSSDDPDYIEAIYELMESMSDKKDILDSLNTTQKLQLEEGLKDINEGRVTPHEEVKARYGL